MSSTLHNLLTDPFFYGALTLIGSGLAVLVRLVAQASVDNRFAQRLESHKHDLQLIAERTRFEHQMRLASASLYLQKQHSAGAEIYAAVRVAHGYVSRLFGIQVAYNLDDCAESDLREIMKSYEVLSGKQEEILATWKQNKKHGIEVLQKHLFDIRAPLAENKLQAARNVMYLNEIYFSDSVIRAMDGFVGVCNEWIARSLFPPERGQQVKMVSREELNGALEAVQTALRTELSGGSFETSPDRPSAAVKLTE